MLLNIFSYGLLDICISSSGFPCDSAGKESTHNAGDLGSIPGLGRVPGEGNGYLLQYSGLENSMECIVHGVAKNWTWLSHFHFRFFDETAIQMCWIIKKKKWALCFPITEF